MIRNFLLRKDMPVEKDIWKIILSKIMDSGIYLSVCKK